MTFTIIEDNGEILITFDTEGKAHRMNIKAALAMRIELYKAVGEAMKTQMIREHNNVRH